MTSSTLMIQRGLVALAAGASLTLALPVSAAPGSLTVEQAVELAIKTNPRLIAARSRLEGSEERTTSAGRRMLPLVHLSEEWQYWNDNFSVAFAIPGAPPAAFLAREQRTNTFVAAIQQPVVGLLHLDEEREALAAGTESGRAQIAAAEADLRQSVETQYLRYFEALAVKQIADASERELGAEVEVARARLASGVITRADMLRIEVAVANAHQQGLQAISQAQVARASLLALIGTGAADAGVTLVEPRTLLAAARTPPAQFDALLPQAQARRPEIAQQQHLIESADRQASARGYSLLPEVNAEAAYLRTDGQVFAPKNSAYVGVKADWSIWEWGASEHLRRAAAADAAAARRDLEATQRQVESDLAASLAQGDAARGAVDAAEKAIASAEEAFRVTQAQVKAGAATTTDLLQAESELTQARLNLTRAQYELALAHVAVKRASGV
jgi:outer membrane protein